MPTLRRFAISCGLLALLRLAAPAAPAAPAFYLKDGDRVVFYGDSITDQRWYTNFTETFVLTRFPGMKVTFVNSGVGGDRVDGGGGGTIDVRLRRDVFAYKPTVMTIMLGMNDGKYQAFDETIFGAYSNGYRSIIHNVKEALPGVRITVIEPSPYDDATRAANFEGGYNKVLIRYGAFVKELANTESLTVADVNTPVVAALQKANELDAKGAQTIIPDRVHPAPGGHLLMAGALLKSWNAPSLVAGVEIDAAARQVTKAENAEVTALNADATVSWTETDAALPMPLDKNDGTLALALRASDFVDTLDREPLLVTGLTAPRYRLEIDGESAGVFTKEQLAAGINLATLSTPMTKQAARVLELTQRHNVLHFARWRLVEINLESVPVTHMRQAVEALDALEGEVIVQQRAAAQPKAHRFELRAE